MTPLITATQQILINLGEFFHFWFNYSLAIRILRIAVEIVLMIVLGRIELLERLDLSHDGGVISLAVV